MFSQVKDADENSGQCSVAALVGRYILFFVSKEFFQISSSEQLQTVLCKLRFKRFLYFMKINIFLAQV